MSSWASCRFCATSFGIVNEPLSSGFGFGFTGELVVVVVPAAGVVTVAVGAMTVTVGPALVVLPQAATARTPATEAARMIACLIAGSPYVDVPFPGRSLLASPLDSRSHRVKL